jgi:hypothetical protein
MSQEEYNQYLNKIDLLTQAVDSHDDSIKQSLGYRDKLDMAINELNKQARENFAEFIANDPASYDEKADKLRDALSFDTSLQDNITPSISIPLPPVSPTASSSAPVGPAPAPVTGTANAGAVTPAAAGPSQSDIDKEAKVSAFRKYMGSYDPNSSMDQAKMKVIDAALEDFQKQTGKSFDINNSEDLKVMQGIMNTAYQSAEYKTAANTGRSSSSGKKKVTSSNDQALIKFGGADTKAFKKVGKAYIPASKEDLQSGTQIFINNPRKGQGELSKPTYVPVRMERGGTRPQSKLPSVLGSASNLLGDVGRTLDKVSRQPRKR